MTFGETRSVTATFENAAKAERAITWLRSIGLQATQIQLSQETTSDQPRPVDAASTPPRKKRRSFVDSLVDFILPDDAKTVSAGLRATDPCSVTVTDISAAMYDTVVSVLNDEGQVRPDARKPDIAGTSAIKGFIGACLVDSGSGQMLASEGGGPLDLDMVAALNSEFVKANQRTIEQLGLDQKVEDILITLNSQVHLIRPLEHNPSLFVYVALDKASSHLGMARKQLKTIEAGLEL